MASAPRAWVRTAMHRWYPAAAEGPCDDTPMTDFRRTLRVEPGTRVRLVKRDLGDTLGWDKGRAEPATDRQLDRLADLQDRLWAEAKRAVLVVLQGIDAAGKDGTIKKV